MRNYGTTNNTPAHRAPMVWRPPRGLAAVPVGGGGVQLTSTCQAPPEWRAPEGPEGTGGLRGAAPNEVRTPSLAGGRGLRRPEHQRGYTATPHQRAGRRGACGARPRCRWAVAGPGRASSRRAERSSRRGRRAGGQASRRPEICRGNKQHEAARPHRGPGGSRIRPLGGSQRLFQRICVPAAPRRSQASTTRAAMPASADLPHVRGSYCFLMPTSPSILRTPS